jgi:outer membrane protein assembly factor BamB
MNIRDGVKITLLMVATLGAFSSSSAQQGLVPSSWPMFQRNTHHTGQSTFTGITTTPLVRWTTQLPGYCGEVGNGMSQSSDGTIYISACGNLSAVNPDDGSIIWTLLGGNLSRSTPAIGDDGMIYWGFADTFVAITTTGEIEWGWTNLSLNYAFASSPAVANAGSIYVTHDGLFAFSRDGSPQWVYPFSWFSHSSPAIGSDGTVYVGSGDGNLYAFAPDGGIKWQRSISTYDNSPSIGSDGTIYIGTNTATIYAYDPDGTLQWSFASYESQFHDASLYAPPVIGADGTIYFGTHVTGGASDYAGIYAINPTGSLKWRVPIHRRDNLNPGVVAPLVIDKDNNLFACTDNGACYGIASDGALLWEHLIEPNHWLRTAPYIVSDGRMLLLDDLGRLYGLVAATDRQYLPLIIRSGNP